MMNLLALGAPHGFDWVFIALIFILLFGAKKLPELARGLGKSLGEFKKAKQDFETELNASLKEEPKPAPPTTPIPGAVPKAPSVSHDHPGQN
jgi:TatA/E family protein of Tat protein translocase